MTMLSEGMFLGSSYSSQKLTFMGRYQGGSTSPASMTGVDIGAADANRVVCCIVTLCSTNAGNPDVTGVTIGGIAATLVDVSEGPSGNFKSEALFAYASVPTGTTATVAVTFTGTTNAGQVTIGVYRIITPSATPADMQDNTAGTPTSRSITMASGAVAIWVTGAIGSIVTVTPTVNATKDGDGAGPTRGQIFGTVINASQQFTVTYSSALNSNLAAISWA